MRRIPWPWVAITAGGMMLAAAMALAQMPPPDKELWPLRPEPAVMGRARLFCDSHDALVAGGLAFLHARLAIATEQEPAWQRFADAVGRSTAPVARLCAEDPAKSAPATLTLPDRLARIETIVAARQEALRSLHPAILDLYGALSDEQRRRADELPLPGGK
jgi:hypothetical protein